MKQRILTGLIGGTGFLYLVWLGGIPYSILIALLALIGYQEFLKMSQIKYYSLEGFLGLTSVLILIAAHNNLLILGSDVLTIILSSLVMYLLLIVIRKNKIIFNQVSHLFVGVLYIGFGFAYMLETRLNDNGFAVTLFVLSTAWATDSGAYFTGKYFGKNKLWPEISPKKTIEGAIGGIIFAVIAGSLINNYFTINNSLLNVIGISFLISVVGQIGDLVESALKRSSNIKDSGTLLPGHGGVLDRFDSLLFIFLLLNILHIL